MNKLASLRSTLLTSPLKIKAANLLTWAVKGKLKSVRGKRNRNFQITYTAKIIVVGFSGNPVDLFFCLLDWLEEFSPGTGEEALTFNTDVPNQKGVDIEISIDLEEVVGTTASDSGLTIAICPDPSLSEAELASLMAELTQLG